MLLSTKPPRSRNKNMKLILGSSSKYRKELLEKASYVFSVLVPEVDEKDIKTDDPYQRPLILARAKADELYAKIKEPALVITADTIVIADGRLYEKPETEEEAREFLKQYSAGLNPEIVCVIVIVNTETGERYEGVDKAKVFFKPFPKAMIEEYMKVGEPLHRAGGFSIQHPIMRPYVDHIEGEEDTVIGAPLHLLEKLLTQAGFQK